MADKLTDAEKDYVAHVIEMACHGTPLQPQAEFAGGYLGGIVVPLLENWEAVRQQIHTDSVKTTVVHSDVKRRRIIKP